MKRILSGPTVVNVEITDVCNVKCRHCYNFWREENDQTNHMEREQFDRLVDELVKAEVFHVILSGGEPFAKFELLEYGFKKLQENNISVSCNTNLMLATDDRIKRLINVGVDHILTSLTSHDPETNDFMLHQEGAFPKIIEGIKIATRNGMRVSANIVVGPKNLNHVYETGLLAHQLGCQKVFGTRMVPSVSQPTVSEEYKLDLDQQKFVLDELVRLKNDTGIMIGTLVSYPLCFLGDLDKYRDFVGRGCPTQSGHVMSLNASGDTHACVHESESYGNVYEVGIREAYKKMRPWHDKSYYYEGCKGCDYIDICETGCAMFSEGYFGTKAEADPCFKGPDAFIKPYKIVHDSKIYQLIDQGLDFSVPNRLRFRREDGFYVVNIRWANSITLPDEDALFLMKYQESGKTFNIFDFGSEKKELLANLFFKDALESTFQQDDAKQLAGLGTNVE